MNFIFLVFPALLLIAGIYAAFRGIGSVIAEKAAIKTNLRALADGNFIPYGKKIPVEKYYYLRLKIILFTVAVILTVTIMIFVMLRISGFLNPGLLNGDSGEIFRIVIITAFAAVSVGAVAAGFFSSMITGPIQKLKRRIESVRSAGDLAKLADIKITIESRDEIAVLGNTINEMIQRLVNTVAGSSDILAGREIQKKFLPLDSDKNGNKLSSGYKDTENAVFFGYYEGAGGISGDYFDYRDIDGRYYAIIKCDVAGKGIPAALIMVQVATMFINYFKQWNPAGGDTQIEEVVYQINGFIETLGFEDRFAALALCIFDTETGDLHFCNAGDNIINIFDSSYGKMKSVKLPETPAAGALSNSTVELKGGYKVQTLSLKHGDILFLYTDGIEEAKRGDEVFGSERVHQIINAVMNRGVYNLGKRQNFKDDLLFDFTFCEGGVDEVIMALIAVEKIFRCYPNPKNGRDERMRIDKKADAFLKKYFFQYENYCSKTSECPENDSYICYTCLNEDEQYDDFAILGIMRK